EGTLALFVRDGDTYLYSHSVDFPVGEPAVRQPFPKDTPVEAAPVEAAPEAPATPEEQAYQARWSAEAIGQFLLDEPRWREGSHGEREGVPGPWTPLVVEGQAIRCWGREYRYEDSLLPAQMVALDAELLVMA